MMTAEQSAREFLTDLRSEVRGLTGVGCEALTKQVYYVAEDILDTTDPILIKVLCRLLQDTYCLALDTVCEALEVVLLGPREDDDEEDMEDEDEEGLEDDDDEYLEEDDEYPEEDNPEA